MPSSGLQNMANQDTKTKSDKVLRRGLIALTAVVVALLVPTALFLGYDLLKSQLSPCASIFEQTTASFETEIKFLETEGKVVLAKEQVTELSERAQMTAINLEGCCQVLDAGRLNPEQFLECKQSARQYEGSLENVVTLVKQAVAAEADQLSDKIDQVSDQVATAVEAARASSQAFNKRVVEVKQEQAIAQLKVTAPAEVEVEAQETEPNNDPLNTNLIELDRWITGAIGENTDADYYTIETPETHRDWIRVELENRSTTLKPSLKRFDADKADRGGVSNATPGANLSHQFVSNPSTKHYMRIGNYNRGTQGAYLVRVRALKAYDAFEPNQDILRAKPISLASPIEASLMDPFDVDYFRLKTGTNGGNLSVVLENRSTTLKPGVKIYNADKVDMGGVSNGTPGANLRHQVAAEPETEYFVGVGNYGRGSDGDYTLTVTVQ